jgi:hypothetical protein
LIELTDIDGSKIVTFAPNGLAGTSATGVGELGHGLPAAEAEAALPASDSDATPSTAHASRAMSARLLRDRAHPSLPLPDISLLS